MAGTYVVPVPAGTQSLVQAVTPLTNVCAGPAVLGGSVLLETAPTPQGPWTSNLGTLTAAASVRMPTNGYVRCTATTQAASMVISDLNGINNSLTNGVLVSSNAVLATPSSATIQVMHSLRIPPSFLNPNFKLEIRGSLNLTNSANVKTLTVVLNGSGGTTVQTLAVTSFASYNFYATIFGSDGQNLKGSVGVLTAGGLGGSATAISTSTLARDYINNETEIVICMTKATAAETAELHSLVYELSV